jgi:rhodanese-related sulfurtransferase
MTRGRQEPGEPFRRISSKDAFEMQQEGALVVDVRTPAEWASGHPQGALHLPVDDFLARAEAELPKDKELLFICAAGSRSAVAAEMAAALEFDPANLYNVEDGVPTWIKSKLPAENG